MRIDVHSHFQCLDFVKHLAGRTGLPRTLTDGGTYVIQCAARLNIPSLPKILDMEEKLRDMDDMKIDVAVLSHGIPFGADVLSRREADDWAARINDDLARIIAAYPGRFAGLGTIGFGDYKRSIAEVDRCIGQLGLRGFQIFSNISGDVLDSPRIAPVLKHIVRSGAPIHLHPAIPLNQIGLGSATTFVRNADHPDGANRNFPQLPTRVGGLPERLQGARTGKKGSQQEWGAPVGLARSVQTSSAP
jgi:predicted TIM-barrel fold metal-dependent hydrolase